MKPSKIEKYNWGWSDMRATNYGAAPTEPTHTRTLYFELINDYPYTSTFSQAVVHNDKIHGVISVNTNN